MMTLLVETIRDFFATLIALGFILWVLRMFP